MVKEREAEVRSVGWLYWSDHTLDKYETVSFSISSFWPRRLVIQPISFSYYPIDFFIEMIDSMAPL